MIELDKLSLTLADLQIDDTDKFCSKLKDRERAALRKHAQDFYKELGSTNTQRRTSTQTAPGALIPVRVHSDLEAMSWESVQHSLEQLIDYAERRDVRKASDARDDDPRCVVKRDWPSGRLCFIYHYFTYYTEESCYDGGCGGTDFVANSRKLIFKHLGQLKWNVVKSQWEDRLRDIIARRAHGKRPIDDIEVLLDEVKESFGYHGFLENANTEVLPNLYGRKMILREPFGLPGMYEISV